MGSTSLTGSSLRTGGPCCCLCSICGSVPGGGWWWSWVLDSVGYTFTHLCLLPAEKLILQWMIFMIRIIVHDFCDFVFFRSSPFFYFLTWASTLKPWVFVRYGCFLFCVPRPILPARAPVKKQKGLQWGGLFAGFQAPQWLRICRPAGGAKKTNKPLGCLEPWGEPHEAHGKVCQVWGLVPPLLLLCCSPVAPLLLLCCSSVAPLLLPCCSPVAPLLLLCCSSVAPLLLPCCSACCSPVAPLVAPLLLACCSPRLILQQDPTDGVQWRQSSLVQIGRMAVPRGAEEEKKSGAGRMSPKTGKTGKTGKNQATTGKHLSSPPAGQEKQEKIPGASWRSASPGRVFFLFFLSGWWSG